MNLDERRTEHLHYGMEKISMVVPAVTNLSGGNWWIGAIEEDAASPLAFDASEGGLWSGNFVPPPPRPMFLDESATPDGLTTCDLCSWAWQNSNNPFALDAALEASGEIGWVLTLIIVSLISAVIGAIVMIIALHCRSRIKHTEPTEMTTGINLSEAIQRGLRPPISPPSSDKSLPPPLPNNINHTTNGIWSWLSKRSTAAPAQLDPPPTSPTENHYTHMDETYGEALYAELDRQSTLDRDSNSPAYQNSAYADTDAPPSSAPSSAYYSDLSITTVPDRAYEVVGLATMPVWDNTGANTVGVAATVNENNVTMRKPLGRLAAIRETITVPSDYV